MATKKTRPILAPGSLVYARVALAHKHMDAELECVTPSTGKADGLGPLLGGMVYDVSISMARRLLLVLSNTTATVEKKRLVSGLVLLEELGTTLGLSFETAVGRNGKVWVRSDNPATVILVGQAILETDQKHLDIDQQRKLVRKLKKQQT